MRLSSPTSEIKAEYDVVVIGSGYGGSITASRMARTGKKVCLLEKGKEFELGEFPDTRHEALSEIQIDLPEKHIGKSSSLYDFRVNKEINVLQGCGLGGTSLINANVSLEPEKEIFKDSRWPKELIQDQELLEEAYKHAFDMLKPASYPSNLPVPAKLKNMEVSASGMHQSAHFYRPPINVNFEEKLNHVGVHQQACTGCGDCVTGCNIGAKNTTQMNYLPDAKNHGAEIYTQTAVQWIEKIGDSWFVYYNLADAGRNVFTDAPLMVKSDIVVLAAGSLGSTEIMLRSVSKGLAASKQLGRHFTGNGDFLGFGYNGDGEANGVGMGTKTPDPENPVGPCITGIIDLREQDNLDDGMVIEEGVAPGALADFLPFVLAANNKVKAPLNLNFRNFIQKKSREMESLTFGAYTGAVNHTMTYLVMTHDDTAGTMRLVNNRLRIDWPSVGKLPIFQKVAARLKEAIHELGGSFIPSPIWNKLMGHDLITVHPLGGCIMAERAENGVVNHKGQVFSGTEGKDVYAGLYICDGSIIPRSLGVNPLLTISALSERNCYYMAKDRNWNFDYDFLPVKPKEPKVEQTGIQFTEKMKGYIYPGSSLNFEEACQNGKLENQPCEFTLTICTDDLDTMLSDENHQAGIAGTVYAPLLSAAPMTVSNGIFNLFKADTESINTRMMLYRMQLNSKEGKQYYFNGFKSIREDPGFDTWQDTTTLFVTIYSGPDDHAPVVAKGILKIAPADFCRQLTTIKVLNSRSLTDNWSAQFKFGAFFAGSLYDVYGGITRHSSVFNPGAAPRKKRALRVNSPAVHYFNTPDHVQLQLTRYNGGSKGPVMLTHGLGVSSLIFSIDTIETNLLEYLYAHGYDVWLLDYRASISLPAADHLFTADEVAKYDYPKAVEEVTRLTGADTIQVVAHCYGATTFSMAMLAGLKGVRSAVLSQIGPHISAPLAARIKSGLYLPDMLEKLGLDSMTVYTDTNADWKNKLFDALLRLNPVDNEDRTADSVSNRISFIYGQLYELSNLNPATFGALHEMFGVANIDALKNLSLMVRKKHVVAADGSDIYLPELKRNMGIPIAFIHGDENACYLPESTETTYCALKSYYPHVKFSRHLISNYGHIDCIFGKNAHKDVYPIILNHLENT